MSGVSSRLVNINLSTFGYIENTLKYQSKRQIEASYCLLLKLLPQPNSLINKQLEAAADHIFAAFCMEYNDNEDARDD